MKTPSSFPIYIKCHVFLLTTPLQSGQCLWRVNGLSECASAGLASGSTSGLPAYAVRWERHNSIWRRKAAILGLRVRRYARTTDVARNCDKEFTGRQQHHTQRLVSRTAGMMGTTRTCANAKCRAEGPGTRRAEEAQLGALARGTPTIPLHLAFSIFDLHCHTYR